MAEVVLENIRKVYDKDVVAVRDFDLDIADGEFMVLVGPSGCGKSTTLRMIAGLEEITDGTLRIGDRVVNDVPPKDRDIAMVFQNYALYPHMSVYENMAFGLRIRRMPKAEIESRVQKAAGTLGITELLQRKPKALSGGQRQRVAMGRALVREPSVFLFDEPLSNLDAKLRVQMRVEISRLHQELKVTMVYVTHDQVEAMTLADRICVMSAGLKMQVGTPMQLYHQPANRFVAGFIGSPAMNFREGTVEHAGGKANFVSEGFRLELTDRQRAALEAVPGGVTGPVTLGLRPQEMRHAPDGDGDFVGHVDVIERMGAETFLYLMTAGGPMVARLHGDTPLAPGDDLSMHVEAARVHLFTSDGTNVLRGCIDIEDRPAARVNAAPSGASA